MQNTAPKFCSVWNQGWPGLICNYYNTIFVLSTHGWEKAIEDQLGVDRVAEKFTVSLEGVGANPAEIHAEFLDIM